ncbi:XRE family transcriptional regulator [Modestobacter lapidis]|nr:helix-turn-helix transcriptional regulator [Modestobacter lapidis]
MTDVRTLGRNVRRIRQERGLSLGNLAREAGLAKQTLANLENGAGNPTVETMLAVARALGVGVNWLVTEWGSPVLVQRREEAGWAHAPSGRQRELDRVHGTGQVTTTLLELTGQSAVVRPALSPGTLLHAYVVSGDVVAGPVDDPRKLQAGDFIRFPGDVPHVAWSPSATAELHLVTTVPQVQQFSPG